MSLVLHLMRHDVRQHRLLLAAWTLVVVAHPLLATLLTPPTPWLGPAAGSVSFALLIIGARLVTAAVLTTGLVQQDAPWSDRAFWRTRPVPTRTMAAAKLAGIAGWLVLLPTLTVCVVAWLAEVPAARWPAMVRHVVAVDGAALGLVLVAAVATRHVSTALLAALLGLVGAVFAFSIAARGASGTVDLAGLATVAADPFMAFPTLMLVCAVATWTIAALAFGGPRQRASILVAAAVGVLTLLAVWFLPAARLHRREPAPAPPEVALRLSRGDVRAMRLPGSRRVALVTTFRTEGVPSEDVQDVRLTSGTVRDGDRSLPARRSSDPNIAPRLDAQPRVMVMVLDDAQLAELRGRRLRFSGHYVMDARLGRGSVADRLGPEVRLDTPTAVFRGEATTDAHAAVARGALTVVTDAPAGGDHHEFFLREAGTARRIGPLHVWHARTGLSYVLLLPTLAHPFTWDRVELRRTTAIDDPGDARPLELELQLRQGARALRLDVDATLEFDVPPVPPPSGPAGVRP